MKKKLFIVCSVILLVILSIACVACDTQQSKIVKAEYVQSGKRTNELGFTYYENIYLRIWYDESWFPNDVHIDLYDEDTYLANFALGNDGNVLYGQIITTNNKYGTYAYCFVPNTYMYILDYTFIDKSTNQWNHIPFYKYDKLTIKVIKGSHNNSSEGEVLATYTVKIK